MALVSGYKAIAASVLMTTHHLHQPSSIPYSNTDTDASPRDSSYKTTAAIDALGIAVSVADCSDLQRTLLLLRVGQREVLVGESS